MNLDNDMTRTIGNQFGSATRWFSIEARRPGGAGLFGDSLALFDQNNTPQLLANRQEIKLRGAHNLSNILAACLIAREGGASSEAMRQVITTFTGVAHRLQLVRELNGVTYINDSIATTPERIMAALYAFEEPIVLLAGGRDKHLPWEDGARLIHHKVRHLVLFGEATNLIARAIDHARRDVSTTKLAVHRTANLAEAVTLAAQLANPGDVVLLSPGCASFDEFSSYVERGHRFEALVNQL
jgi:UDP-N-acetylmuramoylalanine--D-glutamate ligase